ncbi:MAG: DUF1273 domain-containing protein [Oscillospiraceae bacterium]|nr:DUF1273 domain-containing protein [Oscillospiraceae bacterium]
MLSCCFTGHRAEKISFSTDENADEFRSMRRDIFLVLENLHKKGVSMFYTGMSSGADIWFAEAVSELKKEYFYIKLAAVVPFRGQDSRYSDEDKRRYREILAMCDETVCLSDHYFKGCYAERNKYMVDHSDVLVALYDPTQRQSGTGQTVRLARARGMEIVYIDPRQYDYPTLFDV